MSGCIKCANCGAVSFYEGGKTKIHCITCYNALRAENERLREALREIANSAGEDACGYTTGEGHSNCIWKARKALKGE